jgi:catechol 2,3-dioxygenase-like lactoylglutathione lyase family enzyme
LTGPAARSGAVAGGYDKTYREAITDDPSRGAPMFRDAKAFSSYSVDDIDRARDFYGTTLGLEVRRDEEMGHLELHLAGGGVVLIYPKPDHAPATFTVLNLPTTTLDADVATLGDRGVAFEHYEGEIATDERGIAAEGSGPRIAWFRDPAGNILSVLEQP